MAKKKKKQIKKNKKTVTKQENVTSFKEPQQVLVIDTKYTEASDLVEWIIELHDKKQMVIAWPAGDLITALGIKGEVKPEHIKQFCIDVIGKKINLVINSTIKEHPSVKNMTGDQIMKLSHEIDQSGFFAVAQELSKENRQN